MEELKNLDMHYEVEKKICSKCGAILSFSGSYGNHMIDNQSVCDDCYFDSMSEVLEKSPLGIPINPRIG
jgi:hypothetical protein